jgi:hypothetical protein
VKPAPGQHPAGGADPAAQVLGCDLPALGHGSDRDQGLCEAPAEQAQAAQPPGARGGGRHAQNRRERHRGEDDPTRVVYRSSRGSEKATPPTLQQL